VAYSYVRNRKIGFDGSYSKITYSDYVSTNAVSVVAMATITATGDNAFPRILDNSKLTFAWDLNTFGRLIYYPDGSNIEVSSAGLFSYGVPFVTGLTRAGTAYTLYVNGISAGADGTSAAPAAGTTPLTLGNKSDASATLLGSIGEVLVLNRRAPAAEVALITQCQLTRK
jgi:hypothetical protein